MIEHDWVPETEWGFDRIGDLARQAHLGVTPSSRALLDAVVVDAHAAAGLRLLFLRPDWHCDISGARRLIATFEIHPLLFDHLFHGRRGYRAQYYLSAEQGRAYNRRLIDALLPAISEAASYATGAAMTRTETERSLLGPDSKLWPEREVQTFSDAGGDSVLSVPRWERYWRRRKPTAFFKGYYANMPDRTSVELKGTFFRGREHIPPTKDHDRELHESGFT